jgi:hypothetical protein
MHTADWHTTGGSVSTPPLSFEANMARGTLRKIGTYAGEAALETRRLNESRSGGARAE